MRGLRSGTQPLAEGRRLSWPWPVVPAMGVRPGHRSSSWRGKIRMGVPRAALSGSPGIGGCRSSAGLSPARAARTTNRARGASHIQRAWTPQSARHPRKKGKKNDGHSAAWAASVSAEAAGRQGDRPCLPASVTARACTACGTSSLKRSGLRVYGCGAALRRSYGSAADRGAVSATSPCGAGQADPRTMMLKISAPNLPDPSGGSLVSQIST